MSAADQDKEGFSAREKPVVHGYRIVKMLPHDREAFTQGFLYHEGSFFESTGLYGFSTLRETEVESGRIIRKTLLPARYYGEGLSLAGEKLVQLTWQSGKGFVYDLRSFAILKTFSYGYEGWGITFDGKRYIVSDGTAVLRFWDKTTLEEIGDVTVTDQGKPVTLLNELEFVKGDVYANVWKEERIAIISPATGWVKGWIDLHGLYVSDGPGGFENVLNGIAYDEKRDRLFVTGKRWPHIYEIKLTAEPRKNPSEPRQYD